MSVVNGITAVHAVAWAVADLGLVQPLDALK